jgi:hypothetical protein
MTISRDTNRDRWFTSTRSKDGADCVEVHLGAVVGVRDTKDREGGQLALGTASWSALLADLQAR